MGEDHASCIMILNDLVVALTPGPAGVLELRQPLSIRWHRESPTRGHENAGSDQTRGNQILKGFCFSTFLKRFNIKPPPVGCFQGREPHLGHKDHRWPASHLAWTPGYQYFHQKLGWIISSSNSRIFSCLHLNHLSTLPAMAKRPRVAAHGEMWIMLMHNTSSYFSPACNALVDSFILPSPCSVFILCGLMILESWSVPLDYTECHLKQRSWRIGRVHLNKRKNIGQTLAVGRNKVNNNLYKAWLLE